jgi:acetoin utilization deacetylase AcuC-like enzyme
MQEVPLRYEALCGQQGVLRHEEFQRCRFEFNPPKARISDVLRVHDYDYVHEVQSRCAEIGVDECKVLESPPCCCDTFISRASADAAFHAAGAVVFAVDEVMASRAANAFVVVRPPGHHAGPRGLVVRSDGKDGYSQVDTCAAGC